MRIGITGPIGPGAGLGGLHGPRQVRVSYREPPRWETHDNIFSAIYIYRERGLFIYIYVFQFQDPCQYVMTANGQEMAQ